MLRKEQTDNRRQRAEEFANYFRSGETLQEIGNKFGITRERVRQLLSGIGVSKEEGGAAKRAAIINARIAEEKERHCQEKRACSIAQYRMLLKISRRYKRDKGPIRAFYMHWRNANDRGIEWKFKMWEWWEVWQKSGKWEQRGRGKEKYVMARYGDTGPYSPENVYICTQSQNMKDYYDRTLGRD